MNKIPTGFSINPLVGHLNGDQLLGRYIKTDHFFDLLKKESLWFTRVYNWQLIDPCEAEMLPVFKNQLKKEHKSSEYEHDFHKSLIDLSLKSSFGCCFSRYDNYENDHMWQVFTPESSNFGVLIVIKAIDLYNSISRMKKVYQYQYFSKVKYLTDAKAKSMRLKDCSHSKEKNFHYEEGLFLKRISYSNEREVRAVVASKEDSWAMLLHSYIEQEKIPYYPCNAPQPKDCIAVRMRSSMIIDFPNDRSVFLNRQQGEGFMKYIENHYMNNIENGIYIPFPAGVIKKIIVHPGLDKSHDVFIRIKQEIEKNGNINCDVVVSDLYKKSW